MVGLCLAQGPGAACAVRGKSGVRLRGAHALRNGARALAARLAACGMVLSLMAGLAQAQLKLNIPGGGNPFGDAADKAQEDLFTKAAAKLLDEQLPINLDASHVLPTVSALPGGPFAPRPLPLTQANMTEPLPPGDHQGGHRGGRGRRRGHGREQGQDQRHPHLQRPAVQQRDERDAGDADGDVEREVGPGTAARDRHPDKGGHGARPDDLLNALPTPAAGILPGSGGNGRD